MPMNNSTTSEPETEEMEQEPTEPDQSQTHHHSQNDTQSKHDQENPAKPDLAVALEPFGYRKDPITGRRSTTFRSLPAILKDFQDSRQTVYFPDSIIEMIKHYSEINPDPDQPVGDEELRSFFDNAVASGSGLPQQPDATSPVASPTRVRTADSPSSSRSDHPEVFTSSRSPSPSPDPLSGDERSSQDHVIALNQPDSSFLSNNEDSSFNSSASKHSCKNSITLNPLSSPSPGILAASSAFNSSVQSQRRRSSPLDHPGTQHRKPRPPNRRKRGSNATDLQHLASINSSSLAHSTNTSNHSSPHFPCDQDSHLNLHQSPDDPVLESPPHSPSPQFRPSSTDPFNPTPSALLTPNNLSSVIFKNRQLGLYDLSDDYYPLQPQSTPPESDDSNPNDILRRLRSEVTTRPDSKVYTRVFESSSTEGFRDLAPDEEDEILQLHSEDYPNLIRKCEGYRIKNKELGNQILKLEKIHEDEIIKLTDQLDELSQELTSCKKSEKDLVNVTSKLRFQLSNSDDHMARMNKDSNLLQENYQKMKQKWDEAVGESEKLRVELKLRNEELRSAHHNIESHVSDIKKCESDQHLREEHIKNLKAELEELQMTRSILEEQKQANLELKATIDRLKFELEEQRMRNAGSSVGGSRPTSIAGSLNQRLGEEFKKVIASGDYEQGNDDDSGSESTADDDTGDLTRLVKGYADPSLGSDQPEIFDEIRITRFSRRSTVIAGNQPTGHHDNTQVHEAVIDLRDVETNTDDLLSFESKNIQTDPIAEPPVAYRPRTEDLLGQTDGISSEEAASRSSLLQLVTGIDPDVLKLAIDHIHHQQMIAKNQTLQMDSIRTIESTSRPPCSPSSSSSDSASDSDSEISSLDQSDDEETPGSQTSPSLLFSSYLSSWSLSSLQSISCSYLDLSVFSPYWIFNSLPSFGLLKNNSDQESVKNKNKGKNRRHKCRSDPARSESDHEINNNNKESKLQKNLRVCSSMIIFLATGYYLGNLIFSSDLIGSKYYNPTTNKSSLFKCRNCSLVQCQSLEIPYSIGFLSSSSSRSFGPTSAGTGPSSATNTTDKFNHSFVHLKKVGLHHLADFNSIGLGNEGFFVQLRNHVQALVWLKDVGTNMIWKTVTGNLKIPT